MTVMEVYDRYNGPKSLTRKGPIWTCFLGFNVSLEGFGVRGFDARGQALSRRGAIMRAIRDVERQGFGLGALDDEDGRAAR